MTLRQKSTQAAVQLKRADSPAEFRFTGDTGAFEGYASIFNNVDAGGDKILPGAFQEFVTTKDGRVLVLYQHNIAEPIGKAKVKQDAKGLHVQGELMLDDPVASKAYGKLKAGLLDAMSIGYHILPGGANYTRDGVNELSALKLREVSLVTWGMNELARVEVVKTAAECRTVREFEDLIRETLSLSVRKARTVAAAAWPLLGGGQDDDVDDEALADASQKIQSILQQATRQLPDFYS